MNRAVGEDTLFLAIGEQALDRAVGEADLLRAIREVLLDLVVAKFKNLQFVRECCLRGLGFCEVVYDFSVSKSLLDVLVIEVNNRVAVGE